MYYAKIKNVGRLFLLLILITAGTQSISASTLGGVQGGGPGLPLQCASIKVPGEHQLTQRVYARGVQMYRWNGVAWDFVAPVANLYLEPGFFGEIGFHHAGPTWESKAGSKVVAVRVAGTGCTPDATAIPWILLESVSSTGTGIFSNVSYIQRTNTKGGLAPSATGSSLGAVVEVPYTAEYYFYRAVELGEPIEIPVRR